MEKIKIGQIGVCHEHAAGKIISLRGMPEVYEIVGIVDDRASTSAKHAGGDLTPYAGLKWLTEEELFNVPGLQAVTIETPNADLVPTALRCMERNVAMHMDKPGGEDIELFGKLRKGCEERQIPFQMGYMFRNNPAVQLCIRAVRENWLGEVFEIQASMSHNYGDDAYQQYLGEFKGGIMFNLGCHLIDFIVAMLGRPESITPYLKSAPGFPNSVKNNCLTVLEYPHATATVRACSIDVDGQISRRLKVCGSKGTVELSPMERFDGKPLQMRLTFTEGNAKYSAGTHAVDLGVRHDRYHHQLLELAKIINGEMANPCSYEHDHLVQEVVLAAAGYTKWK